VYRVGVLLVRIRTKTPTNLDAALEEITRRNVWLAAPLPAVGPACVSCLVMHLALRYRRKMGHGNGARVDTCHKGKHGLGMLAFQDTKDRPWAWGMRMMEPMCIK
jgi:hypothetical protein